MKKILSLILTLFCVLSLVGCGRSMDDIIKNESSITGVVEEVYNNSILISIQTDAYPYGAYCDVSLDAENKDDMVDFNIGDEVMPSTIGSKVSPVQSTLKVPRMSFKCFSLASR